MEKKIMWMDVKHTCNTVWRVTRNAKDRLWCPICKTSEGFEEIDLGKCQPT